MANYIGRVLSGTVLVLCTVLLLTSQASAQEIRGGMKKWTISGNVGMPDVTMKGLPGDVQTDAEGGYSVQVPAGTSVVITPTKPGYKFEPAQATFTSVKENKTQNFLPSPITYKISGSVNIPGVKMTGLPGDPNSGPDGRYSAQVPHGFNAVVTPEKAGYDFEPASQAYDQVTSDKVNNYTPVEIKYTISGTVTCSAGDANGVVLQGLPGNPRLGANGEYSVKVLYGWHAKVTPVREGCTFVPDSVDYPPVLADCPQQDYAATVQEFTLSGTVGADAVTLKGLPNDPVSDANGSFNIPVAYGYNGKITPILKGYTFQPPFIDIAKVTADRSGLIFTPSIVKLTIAGTISGPPSAIVGVVMDGLPGNPMTDARGTYSAKVDFGFNGTVTPTKEGVVFTDMSKPYSALETDMKAENYTAKAITYTISGSVGQAGVQLTFPGAKTVTSAPDGTYTIEVPYKWKGTVTPRRAGYTFEPANAVCEETLAAKTLDFQSQAVTYTISGKVSSQETGPIADAGIAVEPDNILDKTDAEGVYRIKVAYGWKGSISVTKDGVIFEKSKRQFDTPVVRDMLDQHFTGKTKMLTITNILTNAGEAIQGVQIRTDPGNFKAVTDAKGKYTLSVPFGWIGKLIAEKENWEFEPFVYDVPVTESIDGTRVAPPTPTPDLPKTQPDQTTKTQGDQTKTQGGATPQPPKPAADPERDRLIQALKELGVTTKAGDVNDPRGRAGTPVGGLVDVLQAISAKTGMKIAVDATVRNLPVPATADTTSVMAVLASLPGKPYAVKQQGDTTLVYKPITTTFSQDQLPVALESLSVLADVPIVMDEKVVGQVTANVEGLTLEETLTMVLDGTAFVWMRMRTHYLVASGEPGPKNPAFARVAVTRRVSLNYITPAKAEGLLADAWAPYVKSGSMLADPNALSGTGQSPSGHSHMITVTAPPEIADRIVEDITRLDTRPRQVLLTARVVSMERGNSLNLGVEWGMPTASIGTFGSAYANSAGNDLDPAGKWPWGIQIGYSSDQAFTNALTAQLNLMQRNGQAEIVSTPQVLAMDGRVSAVKNIQEEWFMMQATATSAYMYAQAELQKIESGTILSMTPRIADNNDIQLEMAVEVSNSESAGTVSGLPIVTRRQAQNFVTIPDGGTAAVSGLTENRSKVIDKKVPGFGDLPLIGSLFRNHSSLKESREIAVFVTANIIPESSPAMESTVTEPAARTSATPAPAGGSFEDELRAGLAN